MKAGRKATPHRVGAGLFLAAGVAIFAYGVFGMLRNAAVTTPLATLGILVLTILINDLLLLPFVILVGILTTFVPSRLRSPLRAALLISGTVILLGLWGIEGQIRNVQPGNATILPNRYPGSVFLLLSPIWALFTLHTLATRMVRVFSFPGKS
jgi:hypothetical protein